MPESTDQLAITLTIAEWNHILQILGKEPFNVVAPLVAKITTQGNTQANSNVSAGNGAEAVGQMRPLE